MKIFLTFVSALFLSFGLAQAGLLDTLGFGKKSTNQIGSATLPTSLSQDQIIQGLKEALGKGVQQAVATRTRRRVPHKPQRQNPDAG